MIDEDAIRRRWDAVGSKLDERGRRLFAAIEMRTAGRGGLAAVSKITGLARSTINRGEDDLDAGPLPKRTVRRPGGGRRAVRDKDPGLIPALKSLVEPATLGDPMRPLLWVSKGCGQLLMFWKGGNAILVDFLPELVPPAFGEDEGSQAEDDLCALWGPAHSRTTQPLFDQSFACGLCDA